MYSKVSPGKEDLSVTQGMQRVIAECLGIVSLNVPLFLLWGTYLEAALINNYLPAVGRCWEAGPLPGLSYSHPAMTVT